MAGFPPPLQSCAGAGAFAPRSFRLSGGGESLRGLRRILKPGDAWVIEGTIDYGDGVPVSAVSIIELGADGKIVRETDYFANPFPAPEWRKQYRENMEPAGAR
jgi:hypothetical protein